MSFFEDHGVIVMVILLIIVVALLYYYYWLPGQLRKNIHINNMKDNIKDTIINMEKNSSNFSA